MLGRDTDGTDEREAFDPSGVMRQALDCWRLSPTDLEAVNLGTPPREQLYLWIMRLPSSVNPSDAASALLQWTEPPQDRSTPTGQFAAELRSLLSELCSADSVVTSGKPEGRRGGRRGRHLARLQSPNQKL